jgi:hypothetical protein
MAAAGSIAGFTGGVKAGQALCGELYRCSGEDPGLIPGMVGGLAGGILGAALGATAGGSLAGTRVPFENALAGSAPGFLAGLALTGLVTRLVDVEPQAVWFVTLPLAHGGITSWVGLHRKTR